MSSENNDWFGPTSDIVNKILPDVLIRDEGTIFLFKPLTPRAKQWIAYHVQPDATWFSNVLVVEHQYAWALAVGMQDDGLVLA
ncbi:MAG TPA: hypothetical protein VEV41_19635 [Terriglobales bacterium]|nr:hypothetical protein [Terriglobales bacterium]